MRRFEQGDVYVFGGGDSGLQIDENGSELNLLPTIYEHDHPH